MELELRPVTDEECPAFIRAVSAAFGETPDDAEIEHWRALIEVDRSVAVFEAGQIVANAGAFTFQMTVPGPRSVPTAGVTAVGVRATHRRKGLLTHMMRHQLDDVRDRGEPVAILTASESIIYGRFGYGLGSFQHKATIESAHTAFRDDAPVGGRLRMVDAETAAKLWPDLSEQYRRQQPGDVTRTDMWWEKYFVDREKDRDGASGRFYVVHEDDRGEADGYVSYRVKDEWQDWVSKSELRVMELVHLTPEAYATLWRYLGDVDLINTIISWKRPIDEPVRWMLTDPRRYRVGGMIDDLWVRLVEVGEALAGRTYAQRGRVVLDVQDKFCPWNEGRWELDGGPDGATCARTDADAELVVGVADIGAAYLGGVSLAALASTGRVRELRPGALASADAMFRSAGPQPFCRTGF